MQTFTCFFLFSYRCFWLRSELPRHGYLMMAPSLSHHVFALKAVLVFCCLATFCLYLKISEIERVSSPQTYNSRVPSDHNQDTHDYKRRTEEYTRITTNTSSEDLEYVLLSHSSEALGSFTVEIERRPVKKWIGSRKRLPECRIGYNVNRDNAVLDVLRNCGAHTNYTFLPELESWLYQEERQCAGNFRGYAGEVAHLKEVILNQRKCVSRWRGGEPLEEVLTSIDRTDDQGEHCDLKQGVFQLLCDGKINYRFKGGSGNHLTKYMQVLEYFSEPTQVNDVVKSPTIAVTRYEYYNVYHTMADIYNAFLLTKFLNLKENETNILFIDSHPKGPLDTIWKRLFHLAKRVHELPTRTLFVDLLWNQIGYNSDFLRFDADMLPYIEQFQDFIYRGLRIRPPVFPRDCKRLRVLFIWRTDYIASARNPSGHLKRKIVNEKELIEVSRETFPTFTIEGVRLESLHFRTQVQKVSRTDLLVGMHGAGLTHALFLPKHSGVIEFIPKYWRGADGQFKGIAKWRNLYYERWRNEDESNEIRNESTRIPSQVVLNLIRRVTSRMCKLTL